MIIVCLLLCDLHGFTSWLSILILHYYSKGKSPSGFLNVDSSIKSRDTLDPWDSTIPFDQPLMYKFEWLVRIKLLDVWRDNLCNNWSKETSFVFNYSLNKNTNGYKVIAPQSKLTDLRFGFLSLSTLTYEVLKRFWKNGSRWLILSNCTWNTPSNDPFRSSSIESNKGGKEQKKNFRHERFVTPIQTSNRPPSLSWQNVTINEPGNVSRRMNDTKERTKKTYGWFRIDFRRPFISCTTKSNQDQWMNENKLRRQWYRTKSNY